MVKRRNSEDSTSEISVSTHLSKKGKSDEVLDDFPNKQDLEILQMINRKKLDFDFEKICSVSLSPLNIYCCLTCGKYFKGRSERTPAFLHSVNDGHQVFISLTNTKFYILPEGKEVFRNLVNGESPFVKLLRDIKFSINPIYDKSMIAKFPIKCSDSNTGKTYYNGSVGLNESTSNNISRINTVIIALAHAQRIRDYFLLLNHNDSNVPELVRKISIIIKKLWSPHLFKPHVSPEELISYLMVHHPAVITGKNLEPRMFFLWLLTNLCKQDLQLKKILMKSCQGRIMNTSNDKIIPFWNISLDLPTTSMFKDGRNVNELPQVQLQDLILQKFNVSSTKKDTDKKFSLIREKLPRYLFLHINRFGQFKEDFPVKNRNQTIVNFTDTLTFSDSHDDDKKITYKQIANLIHDPKKNIIDMEKDYESHWKIQTLRSSNSDWIEIDGIKITEKDYALLFLDESYFQIWEKLT